MVRIIALTFVGWSLTFQWAVAGSDSPETNARFSQEELASFSKLVEKEAAAENALAFLLGRVGEAEENLPDGVEFTHVGLAIYSEIKLENGDRIRGYAIHNLYQQRNNPRRSIISQDYPFDFFLGATKLKAGIIIPTPVLQRKMIELVTSGDHIRLHNPDYSVIANPFNTTYQNCTEYILDIIFAAIYDSTDLGLIKSNQKAYFTPKELSFNPGQLFFGTLFGVVRRDDHPTAIKTTTFGTLKKYLEENYGLQKVIIKG